MKTDGFRTIRNSSLDSPEGDLGGSGDTLTVRTCGFRTIRNSSPDSLVGDLGGVRVHFDYENTWFSHNLEFIARFAGGCFGGSQGSL